MAAVGFSFPTIDARSSLIFSDQLLEYTYLIFVQVFLLESQLQDEFHRSDEEVPTNEEDDQRSFFFVISLAESQGSADETTR